MVTWIIRQERIAKSWRTFTRRAIGHSTQVSRDSMAVAPSLSYLPQVTSWYPINTATSIFVIARVIHSVGKAKMFPPSKWKIFSSVFWREMTSSSSVWRFQVGNVLIGSRIERAPIASRMWWQSRNGSNARWSIDPNRYEYYSEWFEKTGLTVLRSSNLHSSDEAYRDDRYFNFSTS